LTVTGVALAEAAAASDANSTAKRTPKVPNR
jgi:hypothetical protein